MWSSSTHSVFLISNQCMTIQTRIRDREQLNKGKGRNPKVMSLFYYLSNWRYEQLTFWERWKSLTKDPKILKTPKLCIVIEMSILSVYLRYMHSQTPMYPWTLYANKDSKIHACPSWGPVKIFYNWKKLFKRLKNNSNKQESMACGELQNPQPVSWRR